MEDKMTNVMETIGNIVRGFFLILALIQYGKTLGIIFSMAFSLLCKLF